MHYGRIVALLGVIVTTVGLFMKSLSSAATSEFMGLAHGANEKLPAEFPTVWTGIWNDKSWASIILVIALVAIVGICFIPVVRDALSRMNALIMTVLGVVVMAIGGVAILSAMDDADAIQAGYVKVAQAAGLSAAPTVSITLGWTLLIVGGALAAIGGVLSLIARPDESALSEG